MRLAGLIVLLSGLCACADNARGASSQSGAQAGAAGRSADGSSSEGGARTADGEAPGDAGDGGPTPIAGGHVDASVPVLPPLGDAMAPDCAWLELETRRVVPTVHLVLDASESMGEGRDPPWAALGEALFATPGGVVAELDRLIAFSATFYTDDPACPTLTEVGPRLLNRYPIEELYDAMVPAGRTPTAEAIDAVVTQYGGEGDDDARSAIILATDGTPTGCAAASSQEAFDAMVASARRAAEADLPVHVISLAPTLTSAEGLQRTANVGLGLPEGDRPGAPIHAPGDADELQATLRGLLDDTLDCRLAVEGELQVARACEGEVTLDDEPLPCHASDGNDAGDGWRAVDATHIELLGTACQRLQRSAAIRISARFPCDVVRPF